MSLHLTRTQPEIGYFSVSSTPILPNFCDPPYTPAPVNDGMDSRRREVCALWVGHPVKWSGVMAANRVRWLVGWGAAGTVCLSVFVSQSLSQSPQTRPVPARPLKETARSGQVAPAETMQPLAPFAANPAPDEASEQTTGCIVLGTGRVYQGIVTELAAAYKVETQAGVVVLPFSEVRTAAPTLTQAYEQIRESYNKPTASDHLDLGRWCEQNQLLEEASLEAQSALVLEPTRKEAVALLKRVEAALGRAADDKEAPAKSVMPRPVQAGAVVSVETQLEFSRHVQRLALNKCGNGACHGASALSPFKLTKGARSEQNLQTFLKYIDIETPEMSPLLVKARSADGPHRGLFQGSKGSAQYASLQAWVAQVAQEQNNQAGIRRRPKEQRQGGPIIMIRPKTKTTEGVASEEPPTEMSSEFEPETASEIETVDSEEPAPSQRIPRAPRQAPLKSAAIKKLLESQDPDAFDPEEFNRLVHGDRAVERE